MNEQYIRGFKEALEWVLHKSNSQQDFEELIKDVTQKLLDVNEKHMTNIEQL